MKIRHLSRVRWHFKN